MLQEIHHRIYNTLQIVSSILSLKSAGLEDPDGRRVMAESNNRIRMIASIYQLAYSNDNLARIELDRLLIQLTQDLIGQEYHAITVRTEYDLESIGVDVQRAISVTMIATELISNALRHAFQSGEIAVLGIRLHKLSPAGWSLMIIENGAGFAVDRTHFKGLAIAGDLCRSLGAHLELESGPDGTRAGLTIYDT